MMKFLDYLYCYRKTSLLLQYQHGAVEFATHLQNRINWTVLSRKSSSTPVSIDQRLSEEKVVEGCLDMPRTVPNSA